MRLLIDQNLSPKLCRWFEEFIEVEQCLHVRDMDMSYTPDFQIWEWARQHDWLLVSKDVDFVDLSVLRGAPPKLIWTRFGNCSVAETKRRFIAAWSQIVALPLNAEKTYVEIW